MPHTFSSQRLTVAIATILATGTLAIAPASAETRIETVLGTVTKSDPIRTSYIRKTPSDEKVCETQEVPVYGQASAGSNNENSDLGAMIIGGVIGLGLGAAIASSNRDRYYDRGYYYNRGYYNDPYYAPPPRVVYRERYYAPPPPPRVYERDYYYNAPRGYYGYGW